jgi:DNA repair protein RecO (recombination protein O)
MPLYRTEAIVMGGWDLGEADRIVSFFTRKKGSIRAVAAGARRMRSKFGGRLQLFTHGHLIYFGKENRNLVHINEFEPLHSFQSLRSDLDRLSHGCYLVELASHLVWEGEVSEEIFSLLLRSLLRLEAGAEAFHVEKGFEAVLLQIAGYRPELGKCLKCKRPPGEDGMVYLFPEEGGILCSDCRTNLSPSFPLSPASLSYLTEARGGDLQRLMAAALSAQERKEVAQAMRAYLSHILQRNLRTVAFLEQLERIPPGGEVE